MKKIALGAVLCTALLLLVPKSASAWGNTWAGNALETALDSEAFRLGALRYSAALMMYNAGYDSDIYFGMLAEKKPDFTFNLVPDFQALYPFSRKFVLEIDEQPDYIFYADNHKERALNNIFSPRLHFVLKNWYFSAMGVFSNVRQRMNPDLDLRVRLKENDLRGIALWQLSKADSLLFQYSTAWLDYTNPTDPEYDISVNMNRRETYYSAGFLLQPKSQAIYFINGEYGRMDFDYASSFYKNTESYAIYAGVEFRPVPESTAVAGRLSGRISIGYNWFNIIDPSQQDYKGLVGNTNFSYSFSRRTSARLVLARAPRFSPYSGMAFYVGNSIGGGFSHMFAQRLTLSYDINYGRNKYEAAAGSTTTGATVKDLGQTISLAVQLRRDLTLTFLGNLWNRQSFMTETTNVARWFAGVMIIYGFPGLEPTVPTIIQAR